MTKISLQDIFTKAWNHFIVNDGQRCVLNGRCKYRIKVDDVESRCAVGLALSSEQIDIIESTYSDGQVGFGLVAQRFPEWFDEQIASLDIDELNDFQFRLHDNKDMFYNKDRLKAFYLTVAEKYNLVVPT